MGISTTLTFLGATGTVTGSRFLVETSSARVLVDCGLYQGLRELRRRNWEPFPVEPASIDAVVLTHAHLDHCGYLPRLVRDGFAGPTFVTESTGQLTSVVLRDSARLQEEDARFAAEKGFSKHSRPLPLYDSQDAERAIATLRTVEYETEVEVASGVSVVLRPSGHILGGAIVELRADGRTAVFSGDLGRPSHPLLRPPALSAGADVLVLESTYGDRVHAPRTSALPDAIRRTVRCGGVVLIPAFAVDRTEVVLMELKRLMESGAIPRVPVFVDSPMALAALEIYRAAVRNGNPGIRSGLDRAGDLFDPGDLREARTVEESKRLNDPQHPCIIVSASGMGTGGRVVHHLAGLLPDPRNTVVLAGYQAVGTRGRDLLEGASQLKMHGRYVPVRADIVDCSEFSVHADADELVRWATSSPRVPWVCYLVHGEEGASEALAARLQEELGWVAVVPRPGERVRLG